MRRLQGAARRGSFTHPLCWQYPELQNQAVVSSVRGEKESTGLQANKLQRHEKGLCIP